MTPEELLKPRYKVIADYPESPYKIGDIEYNDGWSDALSLNDFPAIFRKLEWWEERKPEDMPRYVKVDPSKWDHSLGRVEKVNTYSGYGAVIYFDAGSGHSGYWLPATEEEYKNQNP